MEFAARCGALPLQERAREELLATGNATTKHSLAGTRRPQASERRVVRLAAEGLSNRDIAESLFVTRRTVETHPTHAYQKLDIASREELGVALKSKRPNPTRHLSFVTAERAKGVPLISEGAWRQSLVTPDFLRNWTVALIGMSWGRLADIRRDKDRALLIESQTQRSGAELAPRASAAGPRVAAGGAEALGGRGYGGLRWLGGRRRRRSGGELVFGRRRRGRRFGRWCGCGRRRRRGRRLGRGRLWLGRRRGLGRRGHGDSVLHGLGLQGLRHGRRASGLVL